MGATFEGHLLLQLARSKHTVTCGGRLKILHVEFVGAMGYPVAPLVCFVDSPCDYTFCEPLVLVSMVYEPFMCGVCEACRCIYGCIDR